MTFCTHLYHSLHSIDCSGKFGTYWNATKQNSCFMNLAYFASITQICGLDFSRSPRWRRKKQLHIRRAAYVFYARRNVPLYEYRRFTCVRVSIQFSSAVYGIYWNLSEERWLTLLSTICLHKAVHLAGMTTNRWNWRYSSEVSAAVGCFP